MSFCPFRARRRGAAPLPASADRRCGDRVTSSRRRTACGRRGTGAAWEPRLRGAASPWSGLEEAELLAGVDGLVGELVERQTDALEVLPDPIGRRSAAECSGGMERAHERRAVFELELALAQLRDAERAAGEELGREV